SVEKCRIADESDDLPVQDLAESSSRGNPGTHADKEISYFERRKNAQGVASDVGGVDCFLPKYLFDRVIGCPVGTARTKIGRPRRQLRHLEDFRLLVANCQESANRAFYLYRVKLERHRDQSLVFACNFDGQL